MGNILNFTAESAVPAFRFVSVGSADGNVKLAGAGEACLGVSTDIDTAIGHPCDVQLDGVVRLIAGGNVSFGAAVAPDANGKAVVAEEGDTYGIALESGVAGDTIRVKICNGSIAAAESDETDIADTENNET